MNILPLWAHVTDANLKGSVRRLNPVEPLSAMSDKMIYILCSSKEAVQNLIKISEPSTALQMRVAKEVSDKASRTKPYPFR
jgi:hypothetical protein